MAMRRNPIAEGRKSADFFSSRTDTRKHWLANSAPEQRALLRQIEYIARHGSKDEITPALNGLKLLWHSYELPASVRSRLGERLVRVYLEFKK
ncbi:MAG: hypothetical protein NUV57_00730 [archaeon]|nr:hypothetical protein [archaeon]